MESLNLDYSVDKIKLEYEIIPNKEVQFFMDKLEFSENVEIFYQNNKISSCRYNFLMGTPEARVYVGVTPNWFFDKKSDDTSIILEFNPNKIDPFIFKELEFLKYHRRFLIKILSIDFAVDFAVDYNLLRVKKRDLREKYTTIGKRYIETRYLGDYGDNHVKLYNKALEQGVENVDWSRFEITSKKINSAYMAFAEFEKLLKLPEIYVVGQCSMEEFNLNDVNRLALISIIDDINLLAYIKNYHTRKKFEKYLSKCLTSVNISIADIYQSYINFCCYFFKS